ncbi:DUF6285 domain-containing protein [Pseudomonas sp. Marseille-P9899]|uniref:DUF6285 domain-containing protein n=1 Tax=Pseudomonas sp. Marseille-P9899 TaxID=2730401 RepID=UPI00158E7721|nr:DUF6285 domain-containing protein [Pseudomonas sp. Marseille-P9899]
MSRLPDAHDLLLTARESLLQRLLPALPAELHYDARMLASVLAIAIREQVPAPPSDPSRALTREVVLAIRRGEHDDGSLFPALLEHTRAKLRISNPRLLEVYAGIFD